MFFNRSERSNRRSLILAAVASSLGASLAPAALVSYSWIVTIDQIGPFKAPLPGMEGAQFGDKAIVTFSLNTATSDYCAAPSHGCYATGAANIRFWMPRIGYLYNVSTADLTVSDYSTTNGFDTIRVEAVLPGLNANFLIWLRSTDLTTLTGPAVPTSINIARFDYTRFVGFYGTSAPTSNILSGQPIAAPTCPADLNSDSYVDDADFTLFVRGYNILDCADSSMPANCPADFDYDGLVDDTDFVRFVAAYDALVCP